MNKATITFKLSILELKLITEYISAWKLLIRMCNNYILTGTLYVLSIIGVHRLNRGVWARIANKSDQPPSRTLARCVL